MGEQKKQTITVEITEEQRRMVLDALEDKLLDAKRYLSGSAVDDVPGPLDSCCPAHLARYERNKEIHHALKARKQATVTAIALFSSARAVGL